MQPRRFPLLLALLATALLGLYGFQGYWLYGSYQLARAGFDQLTREALEAAVRQQQLGQAARLFGRQRAGGAGAAGPLVLRPGPGGRLADDGRRDGHGPRVVSIGADGRGASGSRLSPAAARLLAGLDTGGGGRVLRLGATPADSLARGLSQLVVSNWATGGPVEVAALGAAYRRELDRRQLALPFRLDMATAATAAAGRAGFTHHTPPVALNPVRHLAVTASFRPPTAYLLRRLAGSLAGSALLLAVTMACFGLMLRTILRQKKLAAIRRDFVHNMTHELKTPLATVTAAAEALQDFGALADPHRADAYLTMARQELGRLGSLVDQVLRLATEERTGEALVLHPAPVRPAELAAELVRRHELAGAATSAVAFDVQLPAGTTLLADPLHLTGLLHNLLDNAAKYGARRVAVRGGPAPDGGWQLSVADDGPGIAAEHQGAVFEQFFRVPTGNRHPVKGFGLGLYYARQVARAHGGQLRLRSRPGPGSTFILWLPGERALAAAG